MTLLLELFSQFALLAVVAFGGASALLPEMHRVVVENHHWLDDATFTHLFAIAQAAPGPNVLVVTMIGWELAGVPGALAATLGMCLPMSVAIYLLFGHWERFREARWRKADSSVGSGFARVQERVMNLPDWKLDLQPYAYQPELKDKILANMSSRAAESLKEDLESRGPMRLSEVEAQQKEILKIVRRLVDEGQIVLASGGADDFL